MSEREWGEQSWHICPDRANGPLYLIGFSARKAGYLPRFIGPGRRLLRISNTHPIPAGATVLAWGMSPVPKLPEGVRLWRVEDGFLRSAGLGAGLTPPMSWVFDDLGLHFDARRPSRLEWLLNGPAADPALRPRAQALHRQILTARLSKYNLAGAPWMRPGTKAKVVLVAGQVESDAALACGTGRIRRNIDLLRAVRAAEPDAYLIYRPHPDVRAGLRAGGDGEQRAQHYCDAVDTQSDPMSLLDGIDALHVMTSLFGFEALLRKVPVTCWGQPFYAGWGLTEDRVPIPRRTRRLDLEALIAGALIAYPRYGLDAAQGPVSPEEAIAALAALPRASVCQSGPKAELLRWAARWRGR